VKVSAFCANRAVWQDRHLRLCQKYSKTGGKIVKNIFLIGFMGSGKSTVAKALQAALGTEVIEMDTLIAKQQKMAITEIFEKFGEGHFRDLETKLLLDIQKKEGVIVSCGGGVVIRPENVDYMKKSGTIVLLKASPETVYRRVKDSRERPVLNGNMNVEYIAELQEKRRAMYEAAADITIATDGKTVEAISREILDNI
jgi:shikimate kinase